jgi:hypothetical protein
MKQVFIYLMTFMLITSCGGSLIGKDIGDDIVFDCSANLEGTLSIGTNVTTDFSVLSPTLTYAISNSDCDDFTNGSTINDDYDEVSRSGNSLTLATSDGSNIYLLTGQAFTLNDYVICTDDGDLMKVTTSSARLDTTAQTMELSREISLAIAKCI